MKKLLWLDMEMTGLEVEIERVIEVAVIVTDLDFKMIETYQAVVNQPQSFIDSMDEWNVKTHTETGLIEKIPKGLKPDLVETQLCELVNKHWPTRQDRPILCGNSIFQDRKFIDLYFRKFAKLLHYRMMDVTAWKIIMYAKYHIEYQKRDTHRALDDVTESIEELKHFLTHLKVESKN